MHSSIDRRRFVAGSTLAAMLGPNIAAAAPAPVAGKDYRLVTPPQPVTTGSKIEVIDFFNYASLN